MLAKELFQPFRVLRIGFHLFDFVGFWRPWVRSALWWWFLKR